VSSLLMRFKAILTDYVFGEGEVKWGFWRWRGVSNRGSEKKIENKSRKERSYM
jgi:hypothetical protein